ncbi:MAG: transcriptional regulator [Spirochaetaceae bacterium]|nr:MAG: transcriptional regulator [Spirochaetaceae bacterium]
MSAIKRGVILGRFMPPHNGHRYLIDFGRHVADELTVFLCSLPRDPIPGELRLRWMKELFPSVRLVHVTEENPNANKAQPGAVRIWAAAITRSMLHGVDYVFASEHYGFDLSLELGAAFVPVDPSRSLFPVSASAVRAAPMTYWDYLPEPVRPYFVRRVCIAGNDVGQRVALGRALAEHFKTIFAGDYAAFWQEHVDREPTAADLPLLLRAQAASEGALARQAQRLLFVTTDPTQLALRWSVEHGEAADRLTAERQHGYDLYLALKAATPTGTGEQAGTDLLSRYVAMLPAQVRVASIPAPKPGDGHITATLEAACSAVEQLLKTSAQSP